MRRSATRLVLISALLLGSGAHWVVLQSYAWAAMALEARTSPCAVCLTVERGLAEQGAPKASAPSPKVDFIVSGESPRLPAAARLFARAEPESAAPPAAQPPLTPPPRSSLVA